MMRIKVEEAHLLPAVFVRGSTHKANKDIIETVGGLPSYVARMLDSVADAYQKRRATPIKTQLSLF